MKSFIYLAFLLFVSEALAPASFKCHVLDSTGYYDFGYLDDLANKTESNGEKYFTLKVGRDDKYYFSLCSSVIRNGEDKDNRVEYSNRESFIKNEYDPTFRRDSKVS